MKGGNNMLLNKDKINNINFHNEINNIPDEVLKMVMEYSIMKAQNLRLKDLNLENISYEIYKAYICGMILGKKMKSNN
jgi:hypothetical protein